jgi:DNA-binding CsgD family transcriptional regulator
MRFHDQRVRLLAGQDLVGRSHELAVLRRLLDDASGGRSGVLVLRGPAGIGKTALLDSVLAEAHRFTVVRMRAARSETGYPHAGLRMLWGNLRGGSGSQPFPRHGHGRPAAGGDTDVPVAELGRCTRSLIGEAAARQPLICAVDDAHWLDGASAQVLAYALRRLGAHPVAVFLCERGDVESTRLGDLPSLAVGGLSYADLRTLAGALLPGGLDEAVAGRMIREARGNPRLLHEALDCAPPAALAGGFSIPERTASPPVPGDLPGDAGKLSTAGRRLLTLASADPTGDAALLRRAAGRLGLSLDLFGQLQSAGWLTMSPQVTFPAPALRTRVYREAAGEERREVHRALGDATDRLSAPDRRAWHLALATPGGSEVIAADLERTAATARQRGGQAAGAAFLEQATWLTDDPASRGERALAAAAAKRRAGDPDTAAHLLAVAETGMRGQSLRERTERERARIMFVTRRGRAAADRLQAAANAVDPADAAAGRGIRLEALGAVSFAGGRGGSAGAMTVPAHPHASAPVLDQLRAGLAARYAGNAAAAHVSLRVAVDAGRTTRERGVTEWSWLLAWVAWELLDDSAWDAISAQAAREAEQAGDLSVLPYALNQRSLAVLHQGDLTAARTLAQQAEQLLRATGGAPLPWGSLLHAGWRGDERALRHLLDPARRDARQRGEGATLTAVSFAEAVLCNGLGRYDLALAAARDAARGKDLGFTSPALAELVEAAARSGQPKEAAAALDELSSRTRTAGTDWALGIEARAQALQADGSLAEPLFQEAIERLGRTCGKGDLARAHLLYGEWLRRQGRRVDARPHLRAAHGGFLDIGAAAFAERAHREQLATGEKARERSVETLTELTPQEKRITLLARDGLTNPEIGARLFISPRTVEYHLHNAFGKLGITSRRRLHLVLPETAELPGSADSPAVPGSVG